MEGGSAQKDLRSGSQHLSAEAWSCYSTLGGARWQETPLEAVLNYLADPDERSAEGEKDATVIRGAPQWTVGRRDTSSAKDGGQAG